MVDSNADPTRRFTDRVHDYVRYRPTYPEQIISLLSEVAGLSAGAIVADVGCGTGISSAVFLRAGCEVIGIEPNDAMRQAATPLLQQYPGFRLIAGTAEATGLADSSVDYVIAAQAFHWFDIPATAREFRRILKPTGWVVLLWNTRRTDSSSFLKGFEQLLLDYATDYRTVTHKNVTPEQLQQLFAGSNAYYVEYHEQWLDWPGLVGRLLSSSYAPKAGHPNHEPMMAQLRQLYDEHQSDGLVCIEYDCELYIGRPGYVAS